MIPRKAILLCLPLAALSAWLVARSTLRIDTLSGQLVSFAAAGQAEGDSFVETLQGEHAQKLLAAYDARRAIATAVGLERRNRFLGLFGLAFTLVLGFALSVLAHISTELGQDEPHLFAEGAAAPSRNR